MKKLTIIFDADDTLWKNQEIFNEFEEHWSSLIRDSGVDYESARSRLLEHDEKCYKENKFGNIYYLSSMQKTFQEFCPDNAKVLSEEIKDIHDNLFLKPPELFEGVKDALSKLSKTANIYILTKGHYETQKRKIEQSGVENYINGFIVVNSKSIDTYQRLMKQYSLKPRNTVMVGNSPKSDINPAVRLGWYAIYFMRPQIWILEKEDIIKNDRVFEVKKFSEILEAIKEISGNI